MRRRPISTTGGLEIQTGIGYNSQVGMLNIIVVVGLVSFLYLYLKRSNEP